MPITFTPHRNIPHPTNTLTAHITDPFFVPMPASAPPRARTSSPLPPRRFLHNRSEPHPTRTKIGGCKDCPCAAFAAGETSIKCSCEHPYQQHLWPIIPPLRDESPGSPLAHKSSQTAPARFPANVPPGRPGLEDDEIGLGARVEGLEVQVRQVVEVLGKLAARQEEATRVMFDLEEALGEVEVLARETRARVEIGVAEQEVAWVRERQERLEKVLLDRVEAVEGRVAGPSWPVSPGTPRKGLGVQTRGAVSPYRTVSFPHVEDGGVRGSEEIWWPEREGWRLQQGEISAMIQQIQPSPLRVHSSPLVDYQTSPEASPPPENRQPLNLHHISTTPKNRKQRPRAVLTPRTPRHADPYAPIASPRTLYNPPPYSPKSRRHSYGAARRLAQLRVELSEVQEALRWEEEKKRSVDRRYGLLKSAQRDSGAAPHRWTFALAEDEAELNEIEEEEGIEEFDSGDGVEGDENINPVGLQPQGGEARFHWRGKHHFNPGVRKRALAQDPEQRLLKRVKESGTESEDEEVRMVRRRKDLELAREVKLLKAKFLQETRERLERRDENKEVEDLEVERKSSELEVSAVDFDQPPAKAGKRKGMKAEGRLEEQQQEAGKVSLRPAKKVNFRDGK